MIVLFVNKTLIELISYVCNLHHIKTVLFLKVYKFNWDSKDYANFMSS